MSVLDKSGVEHLWGKVETAIADAIEEAKKIDNAADKTYIFEAVASVTASGLSFALPEGVTHSLLVEKINAGFHIVAMATLPEASGSKAGTYALPFTHDWQGGGSAQGDLYFSTTVIDALIYIIISSDDSVELNYYDIERQSHKVTSLSASSTDTQYPSAKAVYNALGGLTLKVSTSAPTVDDRSVLTFVIEG